MTLLYNVRRLDRDDAECWAVLRHEALLERPLAFSVSIPDDPKSLVDFILTRLEETADSVVFGAFVDRTMVGIVGIRRDTDANHTLYAGKDATLMKSIWYWIYDRMMPIDRAIFLISILYLMLGIALLRRLLLR